MSSPSRAVAEAVIAALKGSAAVRAIAGRRAYTTDPPKRAVFPHMTVSIPSAPEDDTQVRRSWTVSVQVDAWSRAKGPGECMDLCAAIRPAVDAITSVTGFALCWIEFRFERPARLDPDGLTKHGLVQFEIQIEDAA